VAKTDFWVLRETARREAMKEMDLITLQVYSHKLEERVVDLENGNSVTNVATLPVLKNVQETAAYLASGAIPALDGQKIQQIKLLRFLFNLGFKEAKEAVEFAEATKDEDLPF
jgi:ribosomal protein L7/L12